MLALFAALKAALPELERLLTSLNEHDGVDDMVYRFYHQSFKVFGIQGYTVQIVNALQALALERKLHREIVRLLDEGTGRRFEAGDNQRWAESTRPLLEAFFHARFFLEMAVRYGKELKHPPAMLPSGWAAFLYLYRLR